MRSMLLGVLLVWVIMAFFTALFFGVCFTYDHPFIGLPVVLTLLGALWGSLGEFGGSR